MSLETDNIFTVVSRPGPVESRILATLAPNVTSHRRVAGAVSLRLLEGGPGPDTTASPLVFLHGRGHAATMWAPILAEFASRRRVLAVDLPGFGHSAAPPFHGSDPRDGLAFFSRPVEALLAEQTGAPPVLVGHSLGALVALELALSHRVAIAGLVLIGAMGLGPVVTPRSRFYLRAGPERLGRFRAAGRWFSRGMPRPPIAPLSTEELGELREELLSVRGGRPIPSRAFDTMVPLTGDAFHLGDRLGELSEPTLLLWGDHDEAFPLPVAIGARPHFRRAELVVLPAGHSPHVESPARVAREIDAWLATVRR